MNPHPDLHAFCSYVDQLPSVRWSGAVSKILGQVVESEGPICSIGDGCEFKTREEERIAGQIIGFRNRTVIAMPLTSPAGLRFGDLIYATGRRPALRVGEALLGRVIDACGDPIDGAGPVRASETWPFDHSPPGAMERVNIDEALGCGIRAIDSFVTCGRGQRLGIFGGSGVGKSTLMGMMARGTEADMTVLALIGERGREVREFLEGSLGVEGLRRSVVIVSTSDQSPLLRIRAALAATAVAEYFAAQGKNVLLVLDSLTRFAMAQREIGLAAGEPPTNKGYTPSVLTMLARLVERAGRFKRGSITAFYTVLMEGDDHQDPLVDTVRSLLDGHVVLDRKMAAKGHYPPIAVLDSLSRLMPAVVSPEHMAKAMHIRNLLATYRESEDLVRIGAYQKGADKLLDEALESMPHIDNFLIQGAADTCSFEQNLQALTDLVKH
jgi:flagellum-specific ATP synthase